MSTIEELLDNAHRGESGRLACFQHAERAKGIADQAVFFALQSHKFASDDTVSCATFSQDSDDERFIEECLQAATSALSMARERMTARYIEALKAAGRVR